MADAESRLNVVIAAQDMASGPLRAIHGSLGALGTAAGTAGGFVRGFAGHVAGLFGAVKNLVLSPAGLLGMIGGLAGITAILKDSVGATEDLGTKTSRLTKITGLSADQASGLLAVFKHYGIDADTAVGSIGMLEKNVGLMGVNSKSAATFYKEFHFNIRDSRGNIKNANDLILQAADYFTNKSIPASKKAALEAKLFGRNWQAMVPVLSLGSDGIRAAAEEAKKLGLTLDAKTLPQVLAFHDKSLKLHDALAGLKLQIGNALMPVLTTMATYIATTMVPHAQTFITHIRDWFDANAPLVEQIKGFVRDVLSGLWSKIQDGFGIISTLVGWVQTLAGGSVLGFLWTQLQSGIGFFTTIIGQFGDWFNANQPVIDQLTGFATFLAGGLTSAFESVTGALGQSGLIGSILDVGGEIATYLIPKFEDLITTFVGPGGVFESVGKVVGPILNDLIPAFGKVVHALFDAGGLIPAIGDLIGQLWGDGSGPLALAVKGIGGLFTFLVGTVLPPVIDMLKNNLPTVLTALAIVTLPPLIAAIGGLGLSVGIATAPILAIGAAVLALYAAIQNLSKALDDFNKKGLLGVLQGIGGGATSGLPGVFNPTPPVTKPPINPKPPGTGGAKGIGPVAQPITYLNPHTGYATGGGLMGGSSYLVGEHGPEMFTPQISGRIMQAGATARVGGGYAPAGPINVQVDGRNLLTFIDQRLYVAVQAAGGGYRPR